MKKRILIIGSVLMLSFTSMAQLKVFSSGSISVASTTEPLSSYKMQVTGNSVFTSTTGIPTSAVMIRGLNTYSYATNPDYTWYGNDQTGIFHPASNNIGFAIAGTERIRISSYGYLGVGDNTPIALFTVGSGDKFQVNGNGIVSAANGSAAAPSYAFTASTNTGIYSSGTGILDFSTAGYKRVEINNSGDVIIGSVNSGKLTVTATTAQNAFATFVNHTSDYQYAQVSYVNRANSKALAVSYDDNETFKVMGSGYVWAAGTYTSSDSTLKENISDIQSALSKVKQLKGVKYNYKTKPLSPNAIENTVISSEAPKTQIGLLAQEVEAIVPEVVMTDENGLKGVAYQNLVALLIEAIKEQQNQIEIMQLDLNNCCIKNDNKSLNINDNNNTGGIEQSKSSAKDSYLLQNRPNPFTSETIIDYYIAQGAKNSSIMIFDLNGKLLKNIAINNSGKGSITINGFELSAGMYHYSLVINGAEIDTKRMILSE